MYKTFFVSLLLCALLIGCTDKSDSFSSFDEARSALKSLNTALVLEEGTNNKKFTDENIVYSNEYLDKRHAIYQQLMTMKLTPNQITQVNYLVIAERFPERFFPWPAQVNVLNNMSLFKHSASTVEQAIKWLKFTQTKLEIAKQSNLKLNKLEYALLQEYVAQAIKNKATQGAIKSHIRAFSNYLANYKPRGSVGLRGLSNGSEWYQSKLNYYGSAVNSPLEWVVIINEKIKALESAVINAKFAKNHTKSFVVQYLSEEPLINGLDWQAHYLDLPAMASKAKLSNKDKLLMLAIMETDIGIHYHAWTIAQAKVNLSKRLKVSEQAAQYLVEDIILYPGQSFSFCGQVCH
jgi:hypothetical protein